MDRFTEIVEEVMFVVGVATVVVATAVLVAERLSWL